IASVGVGARDGEDFLFVKVACGQAAQEQTGDADKRAKKNASRRGPGQHERHDGQGIPQPHAPAREEGRDAHEWAPMRRQTALKTESIWMASMEASVWSD